MPAPSLPKRFGAFIATQSLGAFNDNLFKMLLQLYVLQILAPERAEEIISHATLLFTIPFVLFGPWSGALSDRFSKTRLMQVVKGIEIGILSLGVLGFYWGSLPLLLTVIFLLAAHSTFFSPAKAGLIPEICRPESITTANSWLEMTTFLAILAGTAFAGLLLSHHHNQALIVAYYGVGVALLGCLLSLFMPSTRPAGGHEKFPINPLSGILRDLLFLKRQKGLFLAALANSYFWLLGLIFTTNILVYGKKFLHLGPEDNTLLSLLPAFLGIGIALGSLLAGRWSGKKVELGLVPLGGIGMAFGGIALFFSTGAYTLTAVLLFFTGAFGGLFIVPLYAYLQFEAKEDEKGRVLATAGILNGLFLVLGSLLYRLLAVELTLSAPTIYLCMGLITIGVVVYICTVIPEYLVRFLGWLLTHTFYNIKIIGAHHVPFHGPALLVPNHVSFIDALLVGATIQRFIKFIMYKKYFDLPILRGLCKIMEVIPIAPYEGRASVEQSLETARKRLQEGDVVCIFAEGKITRDGGLSEFRPGLEAVMRGLSSPIIPVYLHNVWGSIFSFEGGKTVWKWPKRIPYPITVIYGHPLPHNAKAAEVEAAVRKLEAAFQSPRKKIKGLYTLCDTTFSPQYSHLELARLLLKGGASILQLRMKGEKDLNRVRHAAKQILEEKKNYNFTFILNDFVELAEELPVDGVHVGQDDLPVKEVRRRIGNGKIIGSSSHSIEEANQAVEDGADYVAFGAIFPTKTKGPGHPVQGLERLKELVGRIKIPVVAIGGITKENIDSVLETGAASVAIITALTQSPDVAEAVRYFVMRCERK